MPTCNGSLGRADTADHVTITSRSPFWKATGTCPVCDKRVSVCRPTQKQPQLVFGTHRASPIKDQTASPAPQPGPVAAFDTTVFDAFHAYIDSEAPGRRDSGPEHDGAPYDDSDLDVSLRWASVVKWGAMSVRAETMDAIDAHAARLGLGIHDSYRGKGGKTWRFRVSPIPAITSPDAWSEEPVRPRQATATRIATIAARSSTRKPSTSAPTGPLVQLNFLGA